MLLDKLGQFERMGNRQDFKKLLHKGTFKSYENRVYLSGACNAGKSTLASVMIGVAVPKEWHSTDGLNIHYGRNGIRLDSKSMIPLPEGILSSLLVLYVILHWYTLKIIVSSNFRPVGEI